MKTIGTMSIGVKMPVLKQGDDLLEATFDSIVKASDESGIPIESGDIFAITESIVARTDGEYLTVDEMVESLKKRYSDNDEKIKSIYLYQPVLSRNRFAIILRAIARASKRVTIGFTIPTDEVGNEMVSREWYMENCLNISKAELEKKAYEFRHPFTGVNYLSYYRQIVEEEGARFKYELLEPGEMMMLTDSDIETLVICNVHDGKIWKRITRDLYKVNNYATLGDLCSDRSSWGLLGCNKVDEETVKLFPSNGDVFISRLQKMFNQRLGVYVECMIYGDGGFKCPECGVWEELDPVISPAYTGGLIGTPNEVKLKYFADNEENTDADLSERIKTHIRNKNKDLKGDMVSQGTTPRKFVDLLGSLADLTSGSGDKGTPCVWIKNYFKNYADE